MSHVVSQARGVPLWNWFAGAGSIGVPYGTGGPGCLSDKSESLPCNFVDITRAQFFWQAWTSLAFGSRGLFEYFYYQDPAHYHCRSVLLTPLTSIELFDRALRLIIVGRPVRVLCCAVLTSLCLLA